MNFRNYCQIANYFFLVLVVLITTSCAVLNSETAPQPSDSTATITLTPETPIPRSTQPPIAPLGEHSYFDRPDDFAGLYQLHILYVVPSDFQYTARDLDGTIDEQVRLVNEWFYDQTGGQTIRFDTYQGKLDITLVILPITENELLSYVAQKYEEFDATYHGLKFLHYGLEDKLNQINQTSLIFQPGKLYVTFFDVSLAYVCGDGPVKGSRIIGLYPSAYNLRDQNNCKAFLGAKKENQRGTWEHILIHEIVHALGFPTACATNLDQDEVHINDPLTPNDIMGTNLGIYDPNPVLDPNHDDYFRTNLTGCSDLSNSPFLSPLPEVSYLPPDVLSNSEWRLK